LKHTLPVGIARRPVAINQDIKALVAGPRAHPAYIAHIVKAAEPVVLKWVRATTADNFPIDNLRELEIPLPPLDEQRRIAAILDKADALRRKRKRTLELLDGLTQSIFLEMFGDDSETESRPLSDLVDRGDRINYGVVQPGDEVSDGIYLVRVSDLLRGRVDHSNLRMVTEAINKKHRRSVLRGKEVLISCVGSIGEVALTSSNECGYNIARAIARIPIEDDLLRTFVAELLKTPSVKRYFTKELRTVSQPTLNIKQIAETLVPLPSRERLNEFQRRQEAAVSLISRATAHLKEVDSLFFSLQHSAFSGQL
jgi:type I restriction enzyme S subunit